MKTTQFSELHANHLSGTNQPLFNNTVSCEIIQF